MERRRIQQIDYIREKRKCQKLKNGVQYREKSRENGLDAGDKQTNSWHYKLTDAFKSWAFITIIEIMENIKKKILCQLINLVNCTHITLCTIKTMQACSIVQYSG